MKKYIKNGSLVAMAATAIFVSSCAKDFELYDPVKDTTAKYEKSWNETFGDIDSNQDWNMATSVTIENPAYSTDAKTVLVYDAMPGSSTTHLMGEFTSDNENLTFDCTKGTTAVYIVAKDAANKTVLADYYAIKETKSAGKAITRADGVTTLGDKITDFGKFQDNKGNFKPFWESEYNSFVNYAQVFDLYNLNNVSTTPASAWKISDIVGIVGTGGVFQERGTDEAGNSNKKHWETDLKPSEGAEYIMESDGPMEISFMFGGTERFNKFGYLYYKDGATEEEIMKAPRYILMDDGRPQGNITVDGEKMGETDGMKLPNYVTSYESDIKWDKPTTNDKTLVGTTYKLAYFGENGTGDGTFTFPKGTHVMFFIIIGNSNTWRSTSEYGYNIRYSRPWMNEKFNLIDWADQKGIKDFVTYKWGGQIVLGVEDEGGDDDMNDILFFIKGNVEDDDIPEIGEEPESQSWIIACEDLGSTDDYDFNDIVFKVSHVAGQNVATVTPLAAGGIYESHIMYDMTDLGETHQLLGAEATTGNYPMINTSSITATGTSQNITVPTDFSLANGMGGLGVSVKIGDSTSAVLITAPAEGTAPQMFCVPGTWTWPTERTKIQEAYPNFADWNGNSANADWYKTPAAGKVLGGN